MLRLTEQQYLKLIEFLDVEKVKEDADVKEILSQLNEQATNPNHQHDFMETLASYLSMPYTKVTLSGGALLGLQRALLSPKELAAVKARGGLNNDAVCASCGEMVIGGTMVTVHNGYIYCANCMAPSFVSCSGCKRAIDMPSSISRIIKKTVSDCPSCVAGIKPAEREPARQTIRTARVPAPPPPTTAETRQSMTDLLNRQAADALAAIRSARTTTGGTTIRPDTTGAGSLGVGNQSGQFEPTRFVIETNPFRDPFEDEDGPG